MIKATLQLDPGHLLPDVCDDYVQTPVGKPVVVYPLGGEVDLVERGWELTLLNDPQGGTTTVTSGGAVKFTPSPGFLGTATIHYLIADQQHNDASATVTVEVQNHFAFHARSCVVKDPAAAPSQKPEDTTGVVASKVFSLIADASFAGTAAPHTEVVGRIYMQCGTMVGESVVTADVDGFWEAHFTGTNALEFYRVEFEQLVTEGNASGKIALQPNDAAWQAI